MIAVYCTALAVGILATLAGIVGVGYIELELGWRSRFMALSVAVIAVGIAAIVVAVVQLATIERAQCEAAGFEWITGKCYGTNVNINGGAK